MAESRKIPPSGITGQGRRTRPVEKRRVARAAEWAALEMRYACKGIRGSNPLPSAFLRGKKAAKKQSRVGLTPHKKPSRWLFMRGQKAREPRQPAGQA